jgi:heme/copper-type cytochrome/quinol oxidase subunit 4
MGYTSAAITSAADIALTLLPVAVVYRIQTSRREKIVLIFILTLAAA